jgi:hypothetical protein
VVDVEQRAQQHNQHADEHAYIRFDRLGGQIDAIQTGIADIEQHGAEHDQQRHALPAIDRLKREYQCTVNVMHGPQANQQPIGIARHHATAPPNRRPQRQRRAAPKQN